MKDHPESLFLKAIRSLGTWETLNKAYVSNFDFCGAWQRRFSAKSGGCEWLSAGCPRFGRGGFPPFWTCCCGGIPVFSHRSPSRSDDHVGQSKECVELMPVLGQASIPHFAIPEQVLHERAPERFISDQKETAIRVVRRFLCFFILHLAEALSLRYTVRKIGWGVPFRSCQAAGSPRVHETFSDISTHQKTCLTRGIMLSLLLSLQLQ